MCNLIYFCMYSIYHAGLSQIFVDGRILTHILSYTISLSSPLSKYSSKCLARMGGSYQPTTKKKKKNGKPIRVLKVLVCMLNIPLRSKLLLALHHLRVTGSLLFRGTKPKLCGQLPGMSLGTGGTSLILPAKFLMYSSLRSSIFENSGPFFSNSIL